jgi:hypothetical protein
MEYYNSKPDQRKEQLIEQKTKSLFVSPKAGLEWFRTQEQCKEVSKKIIKDFIPEEYLAQKLFRYHSGTKDYFYAVLYKDFSSNHDRTDIAEYDADILYLGRLEMGIIKKTTDDNPRSETFKERIDDTESVQMPDSSIQDCPILKEVGYYSYFEATKENCEKLRKTVGVFPKGFQTEFVFSLYNGGNNIQIDSEAEFFGLTIKEAQDLSNQKRRLAEDAKLNEVKNSLKDDKKP